MRLEAKDITFGYVKDRDILSRVDFSLETGEVVGLVGPSGCGKSTLAKILSGRLAPRAGEVRWNGEPLPKRAFMPIQLVYQHPEHAVNPRWRMDRIMSESWNPPQQLQDDLGIEPAWLKRFPNELSGGELQRFCVLRALDPRTRVLICDEMTTMLDTITQAQIWNTVVKVAHERDMGLCVVTHNAFLAERLCDRVVDFTDTDV